MRGSIWLILALVTVGCSTLRVGADFDRSARFSYHTFKWVLRASYGDTPSQVVQQARESIRAELLAKGFTEASQGADADFSVDFTIGSRMRMEVETYPPPYEGRWWNLEDWWGHPYWGYALDVREYREGTLSVDIFDRQSARPVWHGWAKKELRRTDLDHSARPIRRAVRAILADFPPGAAR
jgi:hypothetical protein